MTQEIPRNEWKQFFDSLTRERFDWQTSVEVLNDETGAQMLSEGLAFNGLTLEETNEESRIELLVGTGPNHHQTHTITDPRMVAFEIDGDKPSGTLDIEDRAGTKTLVRFIQPMPVLVKYVS